MHSTNVKTIISCLPTSEQRSGCAVWCCHRTQQQCLPAFRPQNEGPTEFHVTGDADTVCTQPGPNTM